MFSLFPTKEGGKFGWVLRPGERLTPKRRQTLSLRGWANWGVQGGEAPHGGGVSPHKFKRGRVAHIINLPTSGAQYAGEPSANGGGKTGVEGAEPPPRGFGGCAPKNLKKGESSSH